MSSMSSTISIVKQDSDSGARAGILHLPRGDVATPVFMPVGTAATVKAARQEDLEQLGFNLILSNTYHLYLRPGMDVIRNCGGLHRFAAWGDNILTDSGGFQIFSLPALRKITSEGVRFRSHIDGSLHHFTPESVVEIQRDFGSDIQMALDVCTPYGVRRAEAEQAEEITARWAERAARRWREVRTVQSGALSEGDRATVSGGFASGALGSDALGAQEGEEQERGELRSEERVERYRDYRGLLFGIVQGNFFPDLRRRSVERIAGLELPGIALGGLSVGEPFAQFRETLALSAESLPHDRPRYLMGIGTPDYILEAVQNGIDMFDCVFPTRAARNGTAFTHRGRIQLKNAVHTFADLPLEDGCGCSTCRRYSRSYLRHLVKSGEILASVLITLHNLYFLKSFTDGVRDSILAGTFREYAARYADWYGDRALVMGADQ